MQKVTPNQLKLLIYWKQGPGTGGRVFWMRQKTHLARLKRARLLVQRYAGRFTAAIVYDCAPGAAIGQEIERYNSHGNLIIEKAAPPC